MGQQGTTLYKFKLYRAATSIATLASIVSIHITNSAQVAIQGGPKRTERHTSGNKDIILLVSVDGL